MPGRWQSVPGTNTIGAMLQATIPRHVAGTHDLWGTKYPSGFHTSEQNNIKNLWTQDKGYWPSRSGFAQDPAAPVCGVMQQDFGAYNGQPEPIRVGFGGNASLKFIMGRCLDVSSNGVSGAIVQGFVTATDTYVRETTADSNGYYELGTEYPATNHYLVAYRAGAPDIAGTTVNTLQGTNRDGT